MNTLRLLDLHICAFRGISRRLDLDLRAPLTVVYAPNGTGKTTICDAAEWLLTGQVARLGVRRGSDEANLLRCQFSNPNAAPFALGKVRTALDCISLERRLGEWLLGVADSTALQPTTETDVLTRLAPDGAEPGLHHKAASASRQNWIRCTRIFSGELISILLDPDPDHVQLRAQAFADLLGVRPLLDAEKAVRRYRERLRPEFNRVRSEFARMKRELESLEGQPQLSSGIDPDAVRAQAAAEISQAIDNLQTAGFDVPAREEDTSRRILDLVGYLEQQDSLCESRRRAERTISAAWSERQGLSIRLRQVRGQLAEATSAIQQADRRLHELTLRSEAARKLRESATKRVVSCRELKVELDSDVEGVSAALSALASITGQSRIEATLAELDSFVPEIRLESSFRTTRRRLVQHLLRDYNGFVEHTAELNLVERRLAELDSSVPSSEQMADFESEVHSRAAEVKLLAARRTDAEVRVQRLRVAARELIDLLDDARCPVCHHDWSTVEGLGLAISVAIEAVPHEVARFTKALTDAEAALQEAQAKLASSRDALAMAHSLRKRAEELRTSLGQYKLRAAEAEVDAATENLEAALHHARARLDLAAVVTTLKASVARAEVEIGASFARDTPTRRLLGIANGLISAHEADLQISIAANDEEIESVAAEATQVHSIQEATARRGRELQADEAEITNRLRELQHAWTSFAGDKAWTDAELAKSCAELVRWEETLERAHAVLRSVTTRIEVANRIDQLSRQRHDLANLSFQVAELETRYTTAEQTETAFRIKREHYSKEQIVRLHGVLAPLFARMQANQLFDAIRTDESSPLRWIAEVEGHGFDPQGHFSEGQRQDMALAIFLARARGLGGTFFMDEPVAHLDDLNRVACLDIFRMLVMDRRSDLNIVLTTASRPFVRHIIEKFENVSWRETPYGTVPPLRVVTLDGNPRVGVAATTEDYGQK